MNGLPEFFDTMFVQALGWTVLHSLWQGAVVVIGLAVVLHLIKKDKAELRYGFSVMAMVLMLLWSGNTFRQHMKPSYETQLLTNEADTWILIESEAPTLVAIHNLEESPLAYFLHQVERHIHWVFPLWLIGLVVFSIRWIGSMLFLHRLRHRHAFMMEGPWVDQAHALASRLGIHKPVMLLESIKVQSPMVLGHLKPAILLPAGMLTGLEPAQIEAILAHELAHIQRHDYLINLMQSLVEVVFFYHPAYWWIAAQIRDEREHCCDDVAVEICGSALVYARALTDIEAQRVQVNGLAVGLVGRKKHLLARIRRLVAPRPEKTPALGRILSLLMLSLSLFSLAWLSPETNESVGENWEASQFEAGIEAAVFEEAAEEIGHFGLEGFEEGSEAQFEEWLEETENAFEEDQFDATFDFGNLQEVLASAEISIAEAFMSEGELQVFIQELSTRLDTPRPRIQVFGAQGSGLFAYPPMPEMPSLPEMPEFPAFPEAPAFLDSAAQIQYQEAMREHQEDFRQRWAEQQELWQEQQRAYQEQYREQIEQQRIIQAEMQRNQAQSQLFALEDQLHAREDQQRLFEEKRQLLAQYQLRSEQERMRELAELAQERDQAMADHQRELVERKREIERLSHHLSEARKERMEDITAEEQQRMQAEEKRLTAERKRLEMEQIRRTQELKRNLQERQREVERNRMEQERELNRERMQLERELFNLKQAVRAPKAERSANNKSAALRAMLQADGLINKAGQPVTITRIKSGKLKVNGKKLSDEFQGKYQALVRKFYPAFTEAESLVLHPTDASFFDN